MEKKDLMVISVLGGLLLDVIINQARIIVNQEIIDEHLAQVSRREMIGYNDTLEERKPLKRLNRWLGEKFIKD